MSPKKMFYAHMFSKEYISTDPPCAVLNRLEGRGYKVIAATGVGQTLVWTLYKDDNREIVDKGKADRYM